MTAALATISERRINRSAMSSLVPFEVRVSNHRSHSTDFYLVACPQRGRRLEALGNIP